VLLAKALKQEEVASRSLEIETSASPSYHATMRFSWWFYFTKFSLLCFIILMPAIVLSTKAPIFSYVAMFALCIIVLAGASGAILGAIMILRNVKMKCPFCDKYGYISGNKQQGMHMFCDDCGYIHQSGALGLKPVCEELEDESDEE
jgi:hypothetical protein